MRRFTLALLLVLISGIMPAAGQDGGKSTFAKLCARCHTVDKAVGVLRAHPDAGERATWLEQKLLRHYARDAKDRAAIIAFLEETLAATK